MNSNMLYTINIQNQPTYEINIVIATYNNAENIDKIINSIITTISKIPYTLTVVDNASTDSTQNIIKRLFKSKTIDNYALFKRNMGLAVAYNWVLSQVKADYSLYIKPHSVFTKTGWLERMQKYLSQSPTLGMVSCPLWADEQGGTLFNTAQDEILRINQRGKILPSVATLIKKNIFETLGYWCEDYGKHGPIEEDYALRCDLSGFARAYLPNVDFLNYIAPDSIKNQNNLWSKECTNNRQELFFINSVLYEHNFRPLKMMKKFIPFFSNGSIDYEKNEQYSLLWKSQLKVAQSTLQQRRFQISNQTSEKGIALNVYDN